MTILCLPRPRDCASRFLKTWAAARPSLSAVSAVTGSMLAVPRTPSVPKIFLAAGIKSGLRSGIRSFSGVGSRLHRGGGRSDLRDAGADGYMDMDREVAAERAFLGESNKHMDVRRGQFTNQSEWAAHRDGD